MQFLNGSQQVFQEVYLGPQPDPSRLHGLPKLYKDGIDITLVVSFVSYLFITL